MGGVGGGGRGGGFVEGVELDVLVLLLDNCGVEGSWWLWSRNSTGREVERLCNWRIMFRAASPMD